MNLTVYILQLLVNILLSGYGPASYGHGTAVAVYKTKDTIAVAADSRITWTVYNSTMAKPQKIIADSVCKIYTSNNYLFAAAEFASFNRTGFNIFKIAKEVCSDKGDINDIYHKIQNRIVSELIKACSYIKNNSLPVTMKSMVVDYIICGIKNNELTMMRCAIFPLENTWADGKVIIKNILIPESKGKKNIRILMGEIRNRPEIFDLPEIEKSHDSPSLYVKNIVKCAIENFPDVGGNISVACLTKNGIVWKSKSNCNELH